MIQSPQSFVVPQECQKVAWQNGYRRALGETDGWARYGSTTAKGTVWLAAAGHDGPWFRALDHLGIAEGLKQAKATCLKRIANKVTKEACSSDSRPRPNGMRLNG